MINARVFLFSCHASLEYDFCQILQALGMTLAKGNMNRSYEERPCIPGYNDQDYGDAIRARVDNLSCIESDFEGCDLIMLMNPADFQKRVPFFATFKPVVMYLNGQWIDRQLDELAGAINGQMDRKEQPRIWVAVYSKVEEEYLRKRVHTELQDRIHHIRFAKKFEDYYPWALPAERLEELRKTEQIGLSAPPRQDYIYTTCNDIQHRSEACNWLEYRQARMDLRWKLSGRNTDQVGGQGLIPFNQMRQQMRECGAYLGVPCWPAPLVLNMIEAMMSGAPIAYYDNGRGAAQEGIFDGGVGCCSNYVEGLRSFLKRCLTDPHFRDDQSAKSIERAKEFFDFEKQVRKWGILFEQMQTLWK